VAVEPGRLKSTSSMSPGECRPGEFRTEQDLKVIKCYLSGGSTICTSARPARKYFDQGHGRVPAMGVPESSGSNRNWKLESAICPGGLWFAIRSSLIGSTSTRRQGECQSGELHL
jgi:hypothetical protein